MTDFNEGICVIERDDKYGIIKDDGTYLFEPLFDKVFFNPNEKYIEVMSDGKTGYVDKEGNWK